MLNQVLNLTWHTAVFRTMNEARRLEPQRSVNGATWELMTAGYSNIITLGIRRLVDNHPNADSVLNVIGRIERRPELLTREFYVCHDGLPFDDQAVFKAHLETSKSDPGPQWLETTGPEAFDTAARMHEAFDGLCGYPQVRKPLDRIDAAFFATLRAQLKHPAIEKVCTMVDKTVAHAERIPTGAPAVPVATYNDVDEALSIIVRVCQFVSWNLLAEGGFSSVVATPQFDVLEHLDQPWCLPETLPALREHWQEIARSMDDWASASEATLLPKKPT
ncbi:hypothetical protein SNE35_09655 [Paucibacter sp. R3-3]|uniref:HEPN AbiU2-like domain-containing protein n=1 Tax=Roseateles agri TaxID=3098619 RepID=A0ABU5DF49_9BURK|nr:hypothetical protein [Paucibacter sp. R3-3]MDY0744774.1 hypothetical protein [Paucibacter sp. R3-3]